MSFQWSESDQSAGMSLPAPYFYDESIFQKERLNIFFRSWHLVAHVNELRTPGDFVTYDILDQSVIVTRSKEGGIHAFHNVCQHRGNRLINAPRGHTPAITCGYHAWTYSMDGRLRGAPRTECLAGFDKTRHGLKSVRVEIFASFVYVNLDPEAQPVAEMAPGAETQMRRYLPDLDRLTLIEQVDVPVAANWKVIQENSIEGYHFDYSGPVHKQLVQLIDFEGYRLEPRDKYWTYIGPPRKDVTQAYGVPLAGAHWQTDWFFNIGLWPNATIYAFPYSDVVGTFIMNPTGPETSSLRFGYYGVEGRELSDVTKSCIRWMNEELGPEDIRLNISNQKGLRSMGFAQGRYIIGETPNNRSEHLVRHFHRLCHDAIQS
ncbi:MAG TPA: aromatic ring-hydroxylating dioxygenase subunit alpha [Steroidobacteraceae bacterium]|nr:aromatic ring-hydroxylating dioxygenase subunit alpha [Steroidobacteraceae bacterium]